MDLLSERQHIILNRLIDIHVDCAQPVASRLLAEHCDRAYSPATVRHEMGALEEQGLLRHPHTSSGRIPTDRGYRYYVEQCDPAEDEIREPAQEAWQRQFLTRSRAGDRELCADQASRFLSELSEEVGLVLLQDTDAEAAMRERRSFKILLRGTSHLFDKPEFEDRRKIKNLFHTFEEESELSHWISRYTESGGVHVSIGGENELESLKECSVIAARYRMSGEDGGSIAVIGPTRMHYARTIRVVRKMTWLMEQVLA